MIRGNPAGSHCKMGSLPSGTAPRDYAQALRRLHAGMRHVEMTAPHLADRVADARSLLDDRTRTPELDGIFGAPQPPAAVSVAEQ